MKKIFILIMLIIVPLLLICCDDNDITNNNDNELEDKVWNGSEITYSAKEIASDIFGSGVPSGTTNLSSDGSTVKIWNTYAGLDNYGGIQTPVMLLDFSKAVIFQMDVVSCYTQYIVKLAVEGEKEYYYVLSDEGKNGLISVNVVDAMLCDKYRAKNTSPNPGYETGWKYANQKKRCSFHILAKGPDGVKLTAELEIKSISIYNNQEPITNVNIQNQDIENKELQTNKNNDISLKASVSPSTASQKVIWSSENESIATIDQNGKVTCVGVGKTYINAVSEMDQSKTDRIQINVLSGYENVNVLKNKLDQISKTDVLLFNDLYNTTWQNDIFQKLNFESESFINVRENNDKVLVENYYNSSFSTTTGKGSFSIGNGNATIYRNINGTIKIEDYNGHLEYEYAKQSNGTFSSVNKYTEKSIVVWDNGDVKKYQIDVVPFTKVSSYKAIDLMDSSLWKIPNRDNQDKDNVVDALSPASRQLDGDCVLLRQNKYQDAAYCFGGIVSNVLTVDRNKELQIVIDVFELNRKSEFVKTMWEIKALYYADDGITVIDSNPLKIDSGNQTGVFTITFKPTYNKIRIYLVVNGSDIGEQFPDAMMKIKSLDIQMME